MSKSKPRTLARTGREAESATPPPPTVWVFEDQLSMELPSLREAPAGATVLMVESDRNFRAVSFHKHRIAFLVSAMRHFAEELRGSGREVAYFPFAASGYRDSLAAVREHIRRTGCREFWVTEPSEYHTWAWLESLPEKLGIRIRYFANTLFLTDREEFADWAQALKAPVMEHFYRRMRVKHAVLMDGDQPVGGTWNLDKENRKAPPRGLLVPELPRFSKDEITREVLAEVERRFPEHPGSTANFALPVTREAARRALADFVKNRLPLFGDFEDAMVSGQPVLFHSFLSPMLNAGLLSPMQCIRAAEGAYTSGKAPLNSVEGFVRQILGWREFVYGIYWSFMPEYRQRNARGDTTGLPAFFWSGKTEMNCLRQAVGGVIERAYSHHIQRLMVLCNFSTLAGLSPQAVNDWFYAMYADSHDWVVTPNVVGMGMNADATAEAPHRGTMATKPYISSAAYIDRMSDYCDGCGFDPKRRTGEGACPFNYLFWTFLETHRRLYARNPRMTIMLKNAERIDPAEMAEMMRMRERFARSLG